MISRKYNKLPTLRAGGKARITDSNTAHNTSSINKYTFINKFLGKQTKHLKSI